MTIKMIKKDLFDTPSGSLLVHACNCQGSWGAGIAKEFAKRFPKSYREYQEYCQSIDSLGSVLITSENVVCLFTSRGYGSQKDSQRVILYNTQKALESFISSAPTDAVIYSNKFNSGLFGIPWKKTEQILNHVLEMRGDLTWIICEQ